MNAYRGGQRKHEPMQSIAAATGEADVGTWRCTTPCRRRRRADAGQGQRSGRQDGRDGLRRLPRRAGVSSNPSNPSLAGQDAEYFVARCARTGRLAGGRNDEAGGRKLADPAIADLAAYYAGQQPRQPKVASR